MEGMEEVQNENLHSGTDGWQLHPDEEGSSDVPLPASAGCSGGGGRDGEMLLSIQYIFLLF